MELQTELKTKGHERAGGLHDAEKENRWRQIFERHAASGKTIRQFCKNEGINERVFYSWRQTIGKRDGKSRRLTAQRQSKEKENPFVPIRVANNQAASEPVEVVEVVLPGGALIQVNSRTSLRLVCNLITQLEKSRC